MVPDDVTLPVGDIDAVALSLLLLLPVNDGGAPLETDAVGV